MTISLIVTTYNRPDALRLVLDSISRQTRLPDEVVVADDGSGDETRRLLENTAAGFPVPLRHVWQEDKGFRAGTARNKAIAAASGDGSVIVSPPERGTSHILLSPATVCADVVAGLTRNRQRAAKNGTVAREGGFMVIMS